LDRLPWPVIITGIVPGGIPQKFGIPPEILTLGFWSFEIQLMFRCRAVYALARLTGVADVLLPFALSAFCTTATFPWRHSETGVGSRSVSSWLL